MYTQKEKQAVRAFFKYFQADRPSVEMPKTSYKRLGALWETLPAKCYTTPKKTRIKSFWHAKEQKLLTGKWKMSYNGILSCAPRHGCKDFAESLLTPVYMQLSVPEDEVMVDAFAVIEVAREIGLTVDTDVVRRVKSEREYVLKYKANKFINTKQLKKLFK